jgi:hypothetical protein
MQLFGSKFIDLKYSLFDIDVICSFVDDPGIAELVRVLGNPPFEPEDDEVISSPNFLLQYSPFTKCDRDGCFSSNVVHFRFRLQQVI